jgi:hypothetical protein
MSMVCFGPADNDSAAANAKPIEKAANFILIFVFTVFTLGPPDMETACTRMEYAHCTALSGRLVAVNPVPFADGYAVHSAY